MNPTTSNHKIEVDTNSMGQCVSISRLNLNYNSPEENDIFTYNIIINIHLHFFTIRIFYCLVCCVFQNIVENKNLSAP